MENRIAKKFTNYLTDFKQDVKGWFENNEVEFSGKYTKSDFLQFCI